MSRWAVVVARLLTVAVVLLGASALLLHTLNGERLESADTSGAVILAVSFAGVGAVIVSRKPDNVIGWILLVAGTFNGVNAFDSEYARYALVTAPGSLPAGGFVAWVGAWSWTPGAAGFPLILWLFPNGRPASPRWRWLGLLVAAGLLLAAVPLAIGAWDVRVSAILAGVEPDQAVDDPLSIGASVGTALLGLSLVSALISLAIRYRRAFAEERQQIKWLAFAGVLTLIVLLTVSPAAPIALPPAWSEMLGNIALLALPSIPVAIGIAVLRYRLYEIDRIISRTVTYALVVGLLGLVVLGLVAGLTVFLPSDDPLVVAVSTLSAAALFNPVRKRVQTLIDRRFNRSRYDAQRVIGSFTETLQEQVDPDEVVEGWVGVVEETMQPALVGVWVRDGR